MTNTDKVEVALAPLAGAISWYAAPQLPPTMEVARLLLWSAALLLLQGLLRDLWLLSRARGSAQPGGRKEANCLCVESALGITIIVLATLLLGSTFDQVVMMPRWGWGLLVTGSC